MKIIEHIPTDNIIFRIFAGLVALGVLAIIVLTIVAWRIGSRMQPYLRGLSSLNEIHDAARTQKRLAKMGFSRRYSANLSGDEMLNVLITLKHCIESNNISLLIACHMKLENSVSDYIITLRAIESLEVLRMKLDDYVLKKSILPFDFKELGVIQYIDQSVTFWGDIVGFLASRKHEENDISILPVIKERFLVLKSIDNILKKNPKIKTDLENAYLEIYKNAHFGITDIKPLNEQIESKHILNLKRFFPSGYISASSIETTPHEATLYHMNNPKHDSATLSLPNTSVVTPFKVDITALLPAGITKNQTDKLKKLFNENYQARFKNNVEIAEHLTYSVIPILKSRAMFWQHWTTPKQSFDRDPCLGDPAVQVCSTLIAQDLWKSFQVVNCQLKMWGYSEPLKNAFDDYQRLDAILPGDLVDNGIKYGWLTRIRHPEAEKLIKVPATPAGCKEYSVRPARV